MESTRNRLEVSVRISLCLLLSGLSGAAQWEPASEQLAHYPLDGNFTDTSSNGRDATGHDIAFGEDRRREPEKSPDLNGTTSHIRLPADFAGITGANTLTVMLWVKPAELDRRQTLFSFTAAGVTQPGAPLGVLLQLDDTGRPGVRFNHDTDLTRTIQSLVSSRWTHLALVYDGTKPVPADRVLIYLNGEPQPLEFTQPDAIPTGIGGSGESASLGATHLPGTEDVTDGLRGGLDNVRVLNTAWSGDKIRRLFWAERGLHLAVQPALLVTTGELTPGTPYQIQASDDGTAWLDIGNPIPLGSFAGSEASINLGFSRFHRYYRVEEAPTTQIRRKFDFALTALKPATTVQVIRVNQLGDEPVMVFSWQVSGSSSYPGNLNVSGGFAQSVLDTDTSYWSVRETIP
jgi:hypothetical protein